MIRDVADYTFVDVQRLTGAQRGHLARWVDQRIIVPLGGGGISGAHRRYSFRNLFEISLAVELQRFRVHVRFIKDVLTSLQMLDPDTIRTADIPVNRPPRLTSKEYERINRQFLAQQKKDKVPEERLLRLDPDAHVKNLHEALASDEDTDAKRWNRFKDPASRGDMHAFVVVGIGEMPGKKDAFALVQFVDSLQHIEELAATRANLVGTKDARRFLMVLGIPTTIVIDATTVLATLEAATGDHL